MKRSCPKTKPKKPKGKKCACSSCKPPLSVKQFKLALDHIVDDLFNDGSLSIETREQEYAALSNAIIIEGAAMHGALRGYPEGSQPYLVFEHDVLGRLISAAKVYAQFTQIPLESVIDNMLMNMNPRAQLESEMRWN